MLELGCGTGLCGIVAALQDARSVILTDYSDKVLENVRENVTINLGDAQTACLVRKLDFFEMLPHTPAVAEATKYSWIQQELITLSAVEIVLVADGVS